MVCVLLRHVSLRCDAFLFGNKTPLNLLPGSGGNLRGVKIHAVGVTSQVKLFLGEGQFIDALADCL